MMPGLLRRDPARLLKTVQPAGMIPGHHVTTSQINVVMSRRTAGTDGPRRTLRDRRTASSPSSSSNGDSHPVLGNIRRAKRQPVIVAVCADVISDLPGRLNVCPCLLCMAWPARLRGTCRQDR